MSKNAHRGHRFPPAIIQLTVWMYARFTLSLRDVEELLAERGLDVSYETVRRWFLKFGQVYAQRFLNVHAAVYNLFNIDRHLTSRGTMKEFRDQAFRQWRDLTAAA